MRKNFPRNIPIQEHHRFQYALMEGCLMLKLMYNHGGERIPEFWVRDVYFQLFCRGVFFEHKFPFNPSDFVHFRNRVGEEGIAKIFAYGLKLHRKKYQEVKTCFVRHNSTGKQCDLSNQCQIVREGG